MTEVDSLILIKLVQFTTATSIIARSRRGVHAPGSASSEKEDAMAQAVDPLQVLTPPRVVEEV
jgi:hypothetical protein